MRFWGFKTGSRVWGVASKDSDYDIVVLPDEGERLKKLYEYEEVLTQHEEYEDGTIYINEGHKSFNVIILESIEYEAWKYATEAMMKLPKDLIQHRTHRVNKFKQYLTKYRAALNGDDI